MTSRAGAVSSGQMAVALLLTTMVAEALLPVAVTMLLTEHAPNGAVKRAMKLAEPPGAKLGTVNTTGLGTAWLLTTITFFRMALPEFLTVPV